MKFVERWRERRRVSRQRLGKHGSSEAHFLSLGSRYTPDHIRIGRYDLFFPPPGRDFREIKEILFYSPSSTARKQRLQFSGLFSSLLSFLRWEAGACGKIVAVQQEASCKFIDPEEPGSKITVHVPLWGAFFIVKRVCLVSHNLFKYFLKNFFFFSLRLKTILS